MRWLFPVGFVISLIAKEEEFSLLVLFSSGLAGDYHSKEARILMAQCSGFVIDQGEVKQLQGFECSREFRKGLDLPPGLTELPIVCDSGGMRAVLSQTFVNLSARLRCCAVLCCAVRVINLTNFWKRFRTFPANFPFFSLPGHCC
jgi:hypothetical protein